MSTEKQVELHEALNEAQSVAHILRVAVRALIAIVGELESISGSSEKSGNAVDWISDHLDAIGRST